MRHAGLAQGAARAQCRRAGCRGQGEEAGHACVANVTKFAQVKTTQPDEPAEPPRPALQMPDCDKLSARRLQPAQGCAAAAALARFKLSLVTSERPRKCIKSSPISKQSTSDSSRERTRWPRAPGTRRRCQKKEASDRLRSRQVSTENNWGVPWLRPAPEGSVRD